MQDAREFTYFEQGFHRVAFRRRTLTGHSIERWGVSYSSLLGHDGDSFKVPENLGFGELPLASDEVALQFP